MNAAERAARMYIDAWLEPDRDRRAALLDACFALDGRISVLGRPLRGRAEVAAATDAFQVDPRRLTATLTSPIEAGDTVFRFRALFTNPDGSRHSELVDVGEIGDDGRITAIYTFGDPLGDAAPGDVPADASPVAHAVQRYVDLWPERDPVARRARLDACFAADARLIGRTRTFHGPAEIAEMADRFLAGRGLAARRTTAIEVTGSAFRFRAIGEFTDGTPAPPAEDAGEVDGDGRIAVLYAFPGPLPFR